MPLKNGRLTRQEAAFAQHYARTGDGHYAAEKAGYSPRSLAQRAHANLNDEAVMARAHAEVVKLLNDDAPRMVGVLAKIAQGETYAAGARVTAADKFLKHWRELTGEAGEKDPHEMTHDELANTVAALKARAAALESVKADRARPVVELEAEPEGDVFG